MLLNTFTGIFTSGACSLNLLTISSLIFPIKRILIIKISINDNIVVSVRKRRYLSLLLLKLSLVSFFIRKIFYVLKKYTPTPGKKFPLCSLKFENLNLVQKNLTYMLIWKILEDFLNIVNFGLLVRMGTFPISDSWEKNRTASMLIN